MAEKIKTDLDRLLLVLIRKTNFSIYFAKIKPFFKFETKSILSTTFFIFSNISAILETQFYTLWTQTCRNLKSIKFATSRKKFYLNLKYRFYNSILSIRSKKNL